METLPHHVSQAWNQGGRRQGSGLIFLVCPESLPGSKPFQPAFPELPPGRPPSPRRGLYRGS